MRQLQQAPTTSNPASGTGIYQNTSQFSNTSPPHSSHSQQHSQQSQSTVGVATPTLTVTNPQFPQSFQHPPPAPVPQVKQQLNYQVRLPQFNQQFTLFTTSELITNATSTIQHTSSATLLSTISTFQ